MIKKSYFAHVREASEAKLRSWWSER